MMMSRYILLLAFVLKEVSVSESENDRVTCYVSFDVFTSYKEKFCNGSEVVTGSLTEGIYFQYRTNDNRTWITVDYYNATKRVEDSTIEFHTTEVQFRWIQFDTIGSPMWAIDEILIDCLDGNFFKTISFEELPKHFNKFFTCHSGLLQRGAKNCTHTEYSLLLNDTNRELRTISFDILNDTSEEREGTHTPNYCQLQVCLGPTLSHGLIWSTTPVNQTAVIQCSEISKSFWSGLYVTRKCLDGGVWDEVDVSQCTTRDTNKMPFIIYSTYLKTLENFNTSVYTLEQLQQSLDGYNISSVINLKREALYTTVDPSTITTYIITFNNHTTLAEGNNFMNQVAEYLATVEVNYITSQGFTEVFITHPVDACQCNNSFTTEGEHMRITVANICVGVSISPFDIDCKCNEPYYTAAGNDNNCRSINDYCHGGIDTEFGTGWEASKPDVNVTRKCPNGTGIMSRLCNSYGEWDVADVRSCNSTDYHELLERICNMSLSTVDGNELNSFLMDFAEVVTQSDFSTFPLDLKTFNNIIDKIFNVIEKNLAALKQEGANITENLLDIYDEIFHERNTPGFKLLMQVDRNENQKLIEHSEKFGMLYAATANIGDDGENLLRKNFDISVQRSVVRDIDFTFGDNQASVHIPAQLLEQKAKDADGKVPVVNVLYKTLHRLLPDTPILNGQVKEPVSLVISIQVGDRNTPSLPHNNPITLEFNHNAPENVSNITRCAFWNFDFEHDGGIGGWDSTDIKVPQKSHDGHIVCHSFHLTCFVVLVDVSGGSSDMETAESTALSIVSYIGCGISMICLLMAIVILTMYRNTLFKGVLNFTHLNLSIALFLALTVFVAGIETATSNETACTVVAALLHYLFTAAFSWMLCEGILMYILLVKVFSSTFAKKRLPYFILGWGIPVPIVAIAVGIAHRHYGNDKFCWISTDDGAIWAFVGPMLFIVLMNIIILIMVLRILFNTKSQKLTSDEAKHIDVVKSLIKATVVLLPLLGVTWVFGLLAVNKNLSVFAWIFTILNSLQGVLIILFHVLRNKKVRGKIAANVAACTLSVKDQFIPTLYRQSSIPPTNDKTGNSIKIIVELCDGGTVESRNGVKIANGGRCYAETLNTYCSERESNQILSSVSH